MDRLAVSRAWADRHAAWLSISELSQLGDELTIREKVHNLARENMESLAGHVVPGWLSVNPSELTTKVVAQPTSDQIPFDVNTNLIVEFYR